MNLASILPVVSAHGFEVLLGSQEYPIEVRSYSVLQEVLRAIQKGH
jgi:hypothetical protein